MQKPVEPEYLDVRGLAAYSSLAVPSLRDYIRRDNLPCFKVRGKVLVRRSEFEDWLESFRVKTGDELSKIVDEATEAVR